MDTRQEAGHDTAAPCAQCPNPLLKPLTSAPICPAEVGSDLPEKVFGESTPEPLLKPLELVDHLEHCLFKAD